MDQDWRNAAIEIAQQVTKNRRKSRLVTCRFARKFYRTGRLYEEFNPIRLFHLSDKERPSTLRTGSDRSHRRFMRSMGQRTAPPLNVFLSHAKKDGKDIAVRLRDEVRNFSQMEAWYERE